MDAEQSRGPGVRVHPPFIYLLPLVTGLLVQHFVPTKIVSGAYAQQVIALVGWVEIALALLLIAWAVSTLKRRRTPVVPIRPATTLVAEGPFALTRNPMYVAFTVLYIGITFVANAFWPLLFLPEAIVLVYVLAIRLEEAHLRSEFGAAYDEYCARVGRWV